MSSLLYGHLFLSVLPAAVRPARMYGQYLSQQLAIGIGLMLLENIKRFIDARIREHPQIEPWLGDWSSDHETQINVDAVRCDRLYESYVTERGSKRWRVPSRRSEFAAYHTREELAGEWDVCEHGDGTVTMLWEDDTCDVGNLRIPYGAMTESPSFSDRNVYGPIDDHWCLIGTTGWNWQEKKSMWVGFDFDAIANHTAGLTQEKLGEVKQRAFSLPYVTVRTSKSGLGIHLLVYLDPQPTTRTHNEHSQLAKAVLARMSGDCGFDFQAAADVGGGILWHWERGMSDAGCKQITNA